MTAIAQTVPTELAGAKDPALISRYAGSVLHNASVESFASVRVPAGPGRYGSDGKLEFQKAETIEGKVSAWFYVQPKARTALEVFRNYRSAAAQAGFATLYSCEMRACDEARVKEPFAGEVMGARRWAPNRLDGRTISYDIRFLSAKATRNGSEVYLMVFVGEPNSTWQAPATAVVIAELASVELGQVTVGVDALRAGLADAGRVALYGLYFDTGRSEVKPESKPQLDEMARLLSADRALKVAIVGHTDSQGSADANLVLSQRRAEAVVAALVTTYGIEAARLRARGVASFAPVATNRTEAGRAKNRRVELVE